MHSHRDMEILTYVLSGAVTHKDNMSNEETVTVGEIQRMTAGTGVTHSEFNPSDKEELHLLQIWILPEAKDLKPGYEQKKISVSERKNEFHLIAAKNPPPHAGPNSTIQARSRNTDRFVSAVKIHQDVNLYAGVFEKGKTALARIAPERAAWVHVARGSAEISGKILNTGDALSAENEPSLTFKALENSEILFFDLV